MASRVGMAAHFQGCVPAPHECLWLNALLGSKQPELQAHPRTLKRAMDAPFSSAAYISHGPIILCESRGVGCWARVGCGVPHCSSRACMHRPDHGAAGDGRLRISQAGHSGEQQLLATHHPKLVGQHAQSPGFRSCCAHPSMAQRRGVACVHAMALGSPCSSRAWKGHWCTLEHGAAAGRKWAGQAQPRALLLNPPPTVVPDEKRMLLTSLGRAVCSHQGGPCAAAAAAAAAPCSKNTGQLMSPSRRLACRPTPGTPGPCHAAHGITTAGGVCASTTTRAYSGSALPPRTRTSYAVVKQCGAAEGRARTSGGWVVGQAAHRGGGGRGGCVCLGPLEWGCGWV